MRVRKPLLVCLLILGSAWAGCLDSPVNPAPGATPPAAQPPPPDLQTPPEDANESERSATKLIRRDLESGNISLGTSLLYRAYAMFGDDRLPEKYAVGTGGWNLGFFRDAWSAEDNLTAKEWDALAPFLSRPTDPRSVFATVAAGAARPSSSPPEPVPARGCTGPWLERSSSRFNFTVWVTCEAENAVDLADTAIAHLEKHWPAMTALMGAPVLDRGGPKSGGTTNIDVYVVHPDTLVTHGGRGETLRHSDGAAVPEYVRAARAYSGWILIGSHVLASPTRGETTVVHEFFHALQFRFGLQGDWWFSDASATWAETHFAPHAAGQEVHKPRFRDGFQKSTKPLGTYEENGLHQYFAYIWPYMMAQEEGAAAVAHVYQMLQSGRFDDPDDAIDERFAFDVHFGEFALRNLNVELPGNPIRLPHWLDPRQDFPKNARPVFQDDGALDMADPLETRHTIPYSLRELSARYYRYDVPDEDIRLRFDLADLEEDDLDLQAVYRNGLGWHHEELADGDQICRVKELYLVISNPSRDEAARAGQLRVTADRVDLPDDCSLAPCEPREQRGQLPPTYRGKMRVNVAVSSSFQHTDPTSQASQQSSVRIERSGDYFVIGSNERSPHPPGEFPAYPSSGDDTTVAFWFAAADCVRTHVELSSTYNDEWSTNNPATGESSRGQEHTSCTWRPPDGPESTAGADFNWEPYGPKDQPYVAAGFRMTVRDSGSHVCTGARTGELCRPDSQLGRKCEPFNESTDGNAAGPWGEFGPDAILGLVPFPALTSGGSVRLRSECYDRPGLHPSMGEAIILSTKACAKETSGFDWTPQHWEGRVMWTWI